MLIARAEAFARAVGDPPAQVAGGRVGNRVQHEVQSAPAFADRVEHAFHLARLLHVERQRERRFELARQGLHVRPRSFR